MPIRISPKGKGRSFRNTRRENRLEELGRVDAERAKTSEGKRNLRDEKYRIRSELKAGGPAGKTRGKHLTGDDPLVKWLAGGVKGKPHSSKEGREAAGGRKFGRLTKGVGRPSPGPRSRAPRKPDYKSPGRPGGKGPKPDKRPKRNYMTPLKSGGSAKKPRPHGPHLWVRGDKRQRVKKAKGGPVRPIDIPWPKKRVKKGHGGSTAQQHYLQHGYGPHKIKLRSGKPRLAKKGW
jgi:hypothetical protein